MASQITGVSIVYSTVCSGADQRKHQSSASLAFVWSEFPAQKAINAENVSIWWRHHGLCRINGALSFQERFRLTALRKVKNYNYNYVSRNKFNTKRAKWYHNIHWLWNQTFREQCRPPEIETFRYMWPDIWRHFRVLWTETESWAGVLRAVPEACAARSLEALHAGVYDAVVHGEITV